MAKRKYKQVRHLGGRIEKGGKKYTLALLTDEQVKALGLDEGAHPYFVKT